MFTNSKLDPYSDYLLKNLSRHQFAPIFKSANPFSRSNLHGHITASGLVIEFDKVLISVSWPIHPGFQFQSGFAVSDSY
jgi:hypothetical protein